MKKNMSTKRIKYAFLFAYWCLAPLVIVSTWIPKVIPVLIWACAITMMLYLSWSRRVINEGVKHGRQRKK